ncbi:MAG: tRNA dihydrouridine synthase DusB, partial [Rhodospirillales bacterium]|nr:tRNA dihydrouridine synthase DusB [Rhodospirillales bacterium]
GLQGIKIARKHLGWYSKGLPNSAEFRSHVMREDNPERVKTLLQEFYKPIIEMAAA